MRILLVDDSIEMGNLVHLSLTPYEIQQVFSMAEAKTALERMHFDLFLIDIMLPDGDGFEFCRHLSADQALKDIPKVLLTAKDAMPDKVFGFACGADDYITKPVVGIELRARVDARLARQPANQKVQRIHCFEFDSDFQHCFLCYDNIKTDLELTPTEFRILLTLARNEGNCISRQELVNAVWQKFGINVNLRGVDTHIGNLRKKLGTLSYWVVSVYGKGYTFSAEKMPMAVSE